MTSRPCYIAALGLAAIISIGLLFLIGSLPEPIWVVWPFFAGIACTSIAAIAGYIILVTPQDIFDHKVTNLMLDRIKQRGRVATYEFLKGFRDRARLDRSKRRSRYASQRALASPGEFLDGYEQYIRDLHTRALERQP
ncbi:MAG: hypothetical protein OXN90_02280 [Gemmatimonadota bacterium]|nr:hypothetical protein [Gemmatimonadota bacterium]